MTDNDVMGTEMAAPRAAMAAVIVKPEKRSRMMTSFAVQLSDCSEIPPWTHIGPLCGLVFSVPRFGLLGKDGFARRPCANVLLCRPEQIGQAVVSFIISSA